MLKKLHQKKFENGHYKKNSINIIIKIQKRYYTNF